MAKITCSVPKSEETTKGPMRAGYKQISTLVEYMERYGDLSRPDAELRLESQQLWAELVSLLNSLGPVKKTTCGWKKVWVDKKEITKFKMFALMNHARSTGGSPGCRRELTDLQKRVLSVMRRSVVEENCRITSSQPNEEHNPQEEAAQVMEWSTFKLVPQKQTLPRPLTPPSPPSPSSPPLSPSPSSPPLSPSPSSQPMSPSPSSSPLSPSPSSPPQSPTRSSNGQPRATPRPMAGRYRRRRQIPFVGTASEFIALEERRLELEEMRERLLKERETERLRVEAQRIDATRENNRMLRQLGKTIVLFNSYVSNGKGNDK